jgi:hypothetical protein
MPANERVGKIATQGIAKATGWCRRLSASHAGHIRRRGWPPPAVHKATGLVRWSRFVTLPAVLVRVRVFTAALCRSCDTFGAAEDEARLLDDIIRPPSTPPACRTTNSGRRRRRPAHPGDHPHRNRRSRPPQVAKHLGAVASRTSSDSQRAEWQDNAGATRAALGMRRGLVDNRQSAVGAFGERDTGCFRNRQFGAARASPP